MAVEREHPDNLDPLPATLDRWVYIGLAALITIAAVVAILAAFAALARGAW